MKKLSIALLLIAFSNFSFALYAPPKNILRITVYHNATVVSFKQGTLPQSCNHFGASVRFDHRTPTGQAHLALLLSAEKNDRTVEIWYPAASQSGNCSINQLPVANAFSINS